MQVNTHRGAGKLQQVTERLTDIANKCPVHKTLTGQMHILTEVA